MISSALRKASDTTTSSPPPTSSTEKTPIDPESRSPTFKPSSTSASTSTLPSPPFHHIEGLPNFRDLGSYPCQPPSPAFPPQTSYITRPGTLFRSAQPDAITSHGTTTLSTDHQIRRLYDLRSEREVPHHVREASKSSKPDSSSSSSNGVSSSRSSGSGSRLERVFVPVFGDQDYSPEGLARKYKNYSDPDEDEGHGYSAGFMRAYRDILWEAGPAYRKIFEHIRDCDVSIVDDDDEDAENDDGGGGGKALEGEGAGAEAAAGSTRPEPLLFHCAAGKDRTGVFAALVLRLCGVSDEVIAWEYSITELGLGPSREAMIAHLMQGDGRPRVTGVPAMTREQAERAIGSRQANMRVFLTEVLDREAGGVERYMQDVCGLSERDVQAVRRRLVVEGRSVFGDGTGYWKAGERG